MRKAIALIELVFAIVIIGITLLAVPNLIATTTKSSNQAITQEAIASAASHIDMIMSQFWDENSTNPRYNNPILKVANGMPELSEANTTLGFKFARRVGSALSTSRRFAVDINGNILTASTILTKEEGTGVNPDDIDDFNGVTYKLVYTSEHTTAEEGDYKDLSIQLNTRVRYISDAPTNGSPPTFNKSVVDFDNPFDASKIKTNSTNIKSIQVTLKSTNDSKKEVILRAFSCNIGSSKLKERKF